MNVDISFTAAHLNAGPTAEVTVLALANIPGRNNPWGINSEFSETLVANFAATQLDTPVNLSANPVSFDKGDNVFLRWDAVLGADFYFVYVDGNRVSVKANSQQFNLSFLGVGSFNLQVRAASLNPWQGDSELSEAFTVAVQDIGQRLIAPQNTRIENGTHFVWDAVTGSNGYRVFVRRVDDPTGSLDQLTELAAGETSFVIPTVWQTGLFNLYVMALAPDPANNSGLSAPAEHIISATLTDPTDISIVGNVISWSAVPNAVRYAVVVGGVRYYTSTTSFTIRSFMVDGPGDHTARIYAIGNNGRPWLDSPVGTAFPFTIDQIVLDTPFNLRVENGVLYWDSADMPSSFSITINGTAFTVAGDLRQFTIPPAHLVGGVTITITARALGDGSFTLDSETASISYTPGGEAEALSPPTNLSLGDNNVLSWTGEGEQFAVYINGVRRAVVDTNSIDLELLRAYFGEGGEFTLAVRALGTEGDSGLSEGLEVLVEFDDDGNMVVAVAGRLGVFDWPGFPGALMPWRYPGNFWPWFFWGLGLLLLLILLVIIPIVVTKKKRAKVDDGELDECRSKARDAINQAFSELRQAGELVTACEFDASLEQQAMVQLSKTDAAMSNAETCVAAFLKVKKSDKKKAK